MSGAPFIRVPQDYIDRLMPALHESEWRVLLVILRQTEGWSAQPGATRRKERDWITMGQFAKKTGLHRDTISRAVQSLVALNLIRVETLSGASLDTPEVRKKHGGRVYYRLADSASI
jgi:phage replication O-like protein O